MGMGSIVDSIDDQLLLLMLHIVKPVRSGKHVRRANVGNQVFLHLNPVKWS